MTTVSAYQFAAGPSVDRGSSADLGGRRDTAMFENLTAAITDRDLGIGTLTLNRPTTLNPLSVDMLNEIAAAATWFDEQKAKIVVVRGAGRAFTAGADLNSFGPSAAQPDTWATAEAGRGMADALEAMSALAIASIHGWCVGGGVVLAAACDLRLATDTAMFSIPEVDLGIPLAWGGIPRLVREVGPALAKELVLTCRPFDAAEAKASGFLNRVVPENQLEEATAELAQQLARKPRFTLTATKQHVNAVTNQMVGTERSWADAGSLVNAFRDPECADARQRYLSARNK